MVENGADLDAEVYCAPERPLYTPDDIISQLLTYIIYGPTRCIIPCGWNFFFAFNYPIYSFRGLKYSLGDLLLFGILKEVEPTWFKPFSFTPKTRISTILLQRISSLLFILQHTSDKALEPGCNSNNLLCRYYWVLRYTTSKLDDFQFHGKIWTLLAERYKQRPNEKLLLNIVALWHFHDFVLMATRHGDPVALKAFLKIGRNENGCLPIFRIFITPLDIATIWWQIDSSGKVDGFTHGAECYEILAARPNIQNGLATIAEIQLLFSIFVWAIAIGGPLLLNRVPGWLHTILIILMVFVYVLMTRSLLMFAFFWYSWCQLLLPGLNFLVVFLPSVNPVICTKALRGPTAAIICWLCNTSSLRPTNIQRNGLIHNAEPGARRQQDVERN